MRIGAAVRDAVASDRTPIVVVTPGASAESVAFAIRQELESAGAVRTITVARTGRTKTDISSPTDSDSDSSARLTVIIDGQWLPIDDATDAHVEPDDDRLVVVRRPGNIPAWLVALEARAYRRGVRFEVEPLGVDDLVAAGWPGDAARSAVDATDGWPDLLDAREMDPTMAHEAAVGLSMLDDTARSAVELLVFGAITSDLGELLGIDGADLDVALASIETEGLVRRGVIPVALAAAVRAVTPAGRRIAAVQSVLERPVPGAVVAIAEALSSLDDRGELSMRVQLDAARELMLVDPARAQSLLDAARRSGATAPETAGIVGQMQVLAGNPADALQTLQNARDDPDAQLLAAAAWYALGDVAAAADALDSSSIPELAPWARVGAGRAPAGTSMSGAEDPAAGALTDAIEAWWQGDRDGTADHLARAVLRSDASPLSTWPTTPQAVATVVASRLGDLTRAGHIAETAVADRAGGALHRTTQLLLAAWCAARQGRLDDAAGVLDELDHDALTPRQRWLWATVACSLAVRDPEPGGLDDAVAEASAVLARWAVDLYDLELLGDLAAVMHRVGAGSIDDVLQPVVAIASRSESPADLEFDIAWVRLFATLSTDDFASMSAAAHAVLEWSALRREDRSHAEPSVIEHAAIGAASVVIACVDGGVVADETIDAASALAASGRIHEAARLCGVAAMRTTDEAAARRLLKQSRDWRVQRRRVKSTKSVDRTVTRLSAQEERVARLVDDGLTYKAIAADLFISPKTVEHHVAHVRAKLGAGSRAELLRAIRSYFGEATDSSPS